MFDPVTITATLGIANTAFKTIKEGFMLGKDIDAMGTSIGKWMTAASDIDHAEKMSKNPPLFKKLFAAGSIEEEAMAAFTAKKKLEEQRYELKTFLNMTYGPSTYNELLAMEGKIRKQRQEAIYKQQQLRKKVIEWIAIGLLVTTIVGFVLFLAYLYGQK